jgi:hypothetical protein
VGRKVIHAVYCGAALENRMYSFVCNAAMPFDVQHVVKSHDALMRAAVEQAKTGTEPGVLRVWGVLCTFCITCSSDAVWLSPVLCMRASLHVSARRRLVCYKT